MFKLMMGKFKDPLYKNSIFLIASSLLGAGTGFIYWMIATRFYSARDIGLASATISAVMLLHLFSMMGFEFGLAHYLPSYKGNKSRLINSCMTIVFFVSLTLSIIFIMGLNIWSPALLWIRKNNLILISFIVFTILASLTPLQILGVFVGLRKAKYSFIQNFSSSLLKVGALIILVKFGAYGIFMSWMLALFLAFIIGLILISKSIDSYTPTPTIEREIIGKILHYSLGNYISKIFSMIPSYSLPILVLNTLGAEQSAYFYIAWVISSVLLAIPRWTAHALLAEGSYNPKELRRNSFKALKFIFLLLTPLVLGTIVFGKYILLFFGTKYAVKSFDILLILCLASIPYSFNIVYLTAKRIKEELGTVIIAFSFLAFFTVLGGYILIQIAGIIGVGIGWLAGNVIITVGIAAKRCHF